MLRLSMLDKPIIEKIISGSHLSSYRISSVCQTSVVSNDEKTLITGGADSRLIFWQDVTEEKKIEKAKMQQELALKEQQLANLLNEDDLLSALQLAISLGKPATVLKIVQGNLARPGKQSKQLVPPNIRLPSNSSLSFLA